MRPPSFFLRYAPLCLAAGIACGPALAQQSPSGGINSPGAFQSADGYSILPYTRRGYVGINVGRADYDDFSCGFASTCDDSGTHAHLYTGGYFNEWLGLEVGALYDSAVNRGGGKTRAEGVNASLVGRVPLGAFSVFGKVGATYGRTRVTSDILSGLDDGRRRGFGASYGIGAGFDFTRNQGVVLEWARHEFRVPGGGGRRDLDSLSAGYVFRF